MWGVHTFYVDNLYDLEGLQRLEIHRTNVC